MPRVVSQPPIVREEEEGGGPRAQDIAFATAFSSSSMSELSCMTRPTACEDEEGGGPRALDTAFTSSSLSELSRMTLLLLLS